MSSTVNDDGTVTMTASFPPQPGDTIHVIEVVYVVGLPKEYTVHTAEGTLCFVPEPPPSSGFTTHEVWSEGYNGVLTVEGRIPQLPRPWWRRLLRMQPALPKPDRMTYPLIRVLAAFEDHQSRVTSGLHQAQDAVEGLLNRFSWDKPQS